MRDEDLNFCKFFADIEADPYAIVPQLTVKQFWDARNHIRLCDICAERVDRVLEDNPKDPFPKPGEN